MPAGAGSNRFHRYQPLDIDVNTYGEVPTRRWAPPTEHAVAILEFLQGPGGRTGTIPIDEMRRVHLDVCLERDIEHIGWAAVGRALRKLLGAPKTTDYDADGRRRRVYRIPPALQERRFKLV